MLRIVACFSLTFVALSLLAPAADARPEHKKAFLEYYMKDNPDKEFGKLVKKANCYVCHQGKKKQNRNAYGEELSEFLSKENKGDVEIAIEALKKVEDRHTDPDDEESPTYGDLIKEGKLPGGPLEESKEEPEE